VLLVGFAGHATEQDRLSITSLLTRAAITSNVLP
jgi:hypothetical protein